MHVSLAELMEEYYWAQACHSTVSHLRMFNASYLRFHLSSYSHYVLGVQKLKRRDEVQCSRPEKESVAIRPGNSLISALNALFLLLVS